MCAILLGSVASPPLSLLRTSGDILRTPRCISSLRAWHLGCPMRSSSLRQLAALRYRCRDATRALLISPFQLSWFVKTGLVSMTTNRVLFVWLCRRASRTLPVVLPTPTVSRITLLWNLLHRDQKHGARLANTLRREHCHKAFTCNTSGTRLFAKS